MIVNKKSYFPQKLQNLLVFFVLVYFSLFFLSNSLATNYLGERNKNTTTSSEIKINQANSYQAYFELGGAKYFGKNYNVSGVYDLFIPLCQKGNNLFFTDLRIFDRSGNSFEGNIHLGYRKLYPETKQMFGIYGAFDRKTTEARNLFNQLTLGFEYWRDKLFLGGNIYQPIGKKEKHNSNIETEVNISKVTEEAIRKGEKDKQTIMKHGAEKPLFGVDAEIGYAVTERLTGYMGGYYFADSETKTVAGPKIRLTYDYQKTTGRILGILDGVSIEMGAQHDKPRGIFGYIGIKLKIGLTNKHNSNIQGFDRHMVELVRRDQDIVTRDVIVPRVKIAVEKIPIAKEDIVEFYSEKLGYDKNKITVRELKKIRRVIALCLHPDHGGDEKLFATYNSMVDKLMEKVGNTESAFAASAPEGNMQPNKSPVKREKPDSEPVTDNRVGNAYVAPDDAKVSDQISDAIPSNTQVSDQIPEKNPLAAPVSENNLQSDEKPKAAVKWCGYILPVTLLECLTGVFSGKSKSISVDVLEYSNDVLEYSKKGRRLLLLSESIEQEISSKPVTFELDDQGVIFLGTIKLKLKEVSRKDHDSKYSEWHASEVSVVSATPRNACRELWDKFKKKDYPKKFSTFLTEVVVKTITQKALKPIFTKNEITGLLADYPISILSRNSGKYFKAKEGLYFSNSTISMIDAKDVRTAVYVFLNDKNTEEKIYRLNPKNFGVYVAIPAVAKILTAEKDEILEAIKVLEYYTCMFPVSYFGFGLVVQVVGHVGCETVVYILDKPNNKAAKYADPYIGKYIKSFKKYTVVPIQTYIIEPIVGFLSDEEFDALFSLFFWVS